MADKPKINHNVYILGAGFSFDGGIPLVKDFLGRMADSVDWLYRNERYKEAEAISRVFEFRLRATGAAYRVDIDLENIEELFSLASASENETRADYIPTAIAATIDVARRTASPSECVIGRRTFVDDQAGWNKVNARESTYQTYAKMIAGCGVQPEEQENTVITFNYDTLLEDAFSELRIPFHYGLPTDSTTRYDQSAKCQENETADRGIPIYKLHGSVNWAKPVLKDSPMTVYGEYGDHRALVGNGPMLVPPTWRKVFGGQVSHIWEKAVLAIKRATRIIVIGFSMRPTDSHFKYLLAAGLQDNISLRKFYFVNPGLNDSDEVGSLRNNLFGILRKELERKGVVTLQPSSTHEFLLSRSLLRLINRQYPPDYMDISFYGTERIDIYH
jgi:hypothetical protein